MASSEQLKALVQSHLDNDDERFMSVALQVAAHEARKGHVRVARDLRELVDKAQQKHSVRKALGTGSNFAEQNPNLMNMLHVTQPKNRLSQLVTSERVHHQLKRIIREQRLGNELGVHGLRPRSKVLLVGPPGTGKTLSASILAAELGLPLCSVRLDSLITKFMGETSAKLRMIFEMAEEVRAVYFFDEFDALGATRSTTNDVGESRRILNSFLQMVEQVQSNSLFVCATNHIEILDAALFRRYDDVIIYELPTEEEIYKLFKITLRSYVFESIDWMELTSYAKGLSSAEVVAITHEVLKRSLIEKLPITTTMILEQIDERKKIKRLLESQLER